MNGADRLCDVLLAGGIDVTFANPGTSEMHFVAALDRRPQMRCVLGLFEGVVTAAADGYARMAGRPAATLLHTGPGLANGLANLHNARRAHAPIVNIVGDHASYHLPFDAPLATDIESLARPMSNWLRRVAGPEDVGPAAAEAVRRAIEMPGVATLILPANAAWGEAVTPPPSPLAPALPPRVGDEAVREAAIALKAAGSRGALLLAGAAARGSALADAGRIAAATGARLLSEVFAVRAERGRGRVPLERIPYPIDQAIELLNDIDVLVLAGGPAPVAFFAYPGKPSRLTRDDCRIVELAAPHNDIGNAMSALADAVQASAASLAAPQWTEAAPASGPLTDEAISTTVAALLPDDAIVCDEGLTSGRSFWAHSAGAAPHDYLMLTGRAIGIGMPLATGAAIACPDRKVINLQADGSAMYTVQALWTQAREKLDVITVLYSNRAYAILRMEMRHVGATQIGDNAERMMSLDHPPLDWVALAAGMGVEAARAETCEQFRDLFATALRRRGPFLIEAVLP